MQGVTASDRVITGVFWGTQPLMQEEVLDSATDGRRVAIWRLRAVSPGVQDVVINVGGDATAILAGVVFFSGTSRAVDLDTRGSERDAATASPSISVTTSEDEVVVISACLTDSTKTHTCSGTELIDISVGTNRLVVQGTVAAVAGAATLSSTIDTGANTENNLIVAIAIRGDGV